MTRRIPFVALACLGAALACAASSVGAATIRWKAPVSGLWNDAANWEGAVVPGPADDALIDLDGTYTVTAGNGNVHRVSLGAGSGTQTLLFSHAYLSVYDTLFIHGQGTLDLSGNSMVTGPVVDGGLVVAHGAENRITDLVHVRSGGTLRLGGPGEPLGATDTLKVTADLYNDGTITSWLANGRLLMGGVTLYNRASGTITTTGAALSIEAVLDNAGTVSQRGANRLILDRAGASHVNTGTLDIDSQGYLMLDGSLQVNGGSLVNSGAIALGYNSQLAVRGGGTLALEAGTTIASAGGSVVVEDATLHGDTLAFDVDLELRRSTVDVAWLGVVHDRFLTLGDLTLTAPLWIAGTLVCDGAVVRADTLVSEPTSQVVVNAGAALVLAKGFVNRGLIRAQGGDATLQLDQGTLVNAVGAAIVTPDWPLHIRGALDNLGGIDAHSLALEGPYTHANSGTITIGAGGRMRIAQGGTFDPGAGGLVGAGVLEVDTSTVAGGHLVLPVDTRLQDATIACLSLTNPSTRALETAGTCLIPVPFENRGRLRVTGFAYAQDTLVTGDSSVVTLEPGAELATFRGFTNRGTVQTTAACCTTQPAFVTVLNGAMSNAATGVLSAENGWLQVSGMLDNQGLVMVGNDLPLAPAQFLALAGVGPAWINRGTIEIHQGDTLMVVGRPLVNQAGATLKGNGTIRLLSGSLENAGRIDPGLGASGDGDLALRVLGSVRLMPTSVVHADLWPAYRHDLLAVSDTLWLGGAFEVALRDGFLPTLGDSLPLIVASRCLDGRLLGPCADPFPSAYVDTFATVAFPALPPGMLWDLHYRPQLVGLLVADSTTGVLLALLQCDVRPEGVELRWRFGDPDRIADVRVERAAARTGPWSVTAVERRHDGGTEVALDRSVAAGQHWFYRIVAVQRVGAPLVFGPLEVVTGAAVTELAFAAPAPNPSASGARFEFALPRAAQVRLSLVDVLGREVAVLVDGPQAAGRYQARWSGELAGQRAPAGVYFARLDVDGRELRRRVVVIR